MNKFLIQEALIQALKQQRQAALSAADQAQKTASDSENKPENQYDTLALEAAYLAHGQSERVVELEEFLAIARRFTPKEFSVDDAIAPGALIALQNNQQLKQFYYLSPVGGGSQFSVNEQSIIVINPDAPLAKKLINRFVGDDIEMPVGHWQEILMLY